MKLFLYYSRLYPGGVGGGGGGEGTGVKLIRRSPRRFGLVRLLSVR